jgi:hypothetical protein
MLKILFFILVFFLYACKKCKEPDCNSTTPAQPKVYLNFTMKYGNQELKINDYHVTYSQDTFRTTQLKFYISNIRLKKSDGTEFVEPESYHLFSLDNPERKKLQIQGVPAGEYTQMSFGLGIDSVRNHSGAQVGDLDPANGMFWTWSDGYLFLRYEGVLKKVPAKGLIVHIGEDRYYTPYQINFPQPIQIHSSQSEFEIPLEFNLHYLFNEPNLIAVDSLAHGYPGKVVDNLPFLIRYAL